MRWLFLRTAAAIVITIVVSGVLAYATLQLVGSQFMGRAPELAHTTIFAPMSARLSSLSHEEREAFLDDLNETLGFDFALESPPTTAVPAMLAPEGSDMRYVSGPLGYTLYARVTATSPWLRATLPAPRVVDWVLFFGTLLLGVLVAAAVMLMLSRRVMRQLESLHRATQRLEAGDMSARAVVIQRTELQRFTSAFNAMASRRQADDAEREALLQAVAHELNTPLGRIEFSLDFLRNADSDEERVRQIASIGEEAEALHRLTREVVAWVESGAPQWSGLGESAPIMEIVEDSVARAARHTRLGLEVRSSLAESETVAVNPGLRIVLDNVLQNATRYARRRVVVEVARESGAVRVEVRDDGVGIPERHRERVFEPFARIESHRGREHGGLGLGLAIVARNVARVGGRVRIETATEGGASVVVVWPTVGVQATLQRAERTTR